MARWFRPVATICLLRGFPWNIRLVLLLLILGFILEVLKDIVR